ncbi:MAG TPA: RHS repeat-associated core domain-containing protein [Anaerolineae bacterium]|nr:RHS repeat-associated core domain-containing protein [Anaerolineae bacterium]
MFVANTGPWAEASTVVAQVTKYYTFGGQRVALRRGDVVYYLYADHLGSVSVVSDGSGALLAAQCYFPYGEVRWREGTLPTDFTFTGQRAEAGLGLLDYRARFYDPVLGRFVQADTIVPNPGDPQDLNRYAYVRNNPLRYTDPGGPPTPPDDGLAARQGISAKPICASGVGDARGKAVHFRHRGGRHPARRAVRAQTGHSGGILRGDSGNHCRRIRHSQRLDNQYRYLSAVTRMKRGSGETQVLARSAAPLHSGLRSSGTAHTRLLILRLAAWLCLCALALSLHWHWHRRASAGPDLWPLGTWTVPAIPAQGDR